MIKVSSNAPRISEESIRPRAVVLLSGGLDSATTLAICRAEGYVPYALTIAYGQRHAVEAEAARRVASSLGGARHVEMALDLSTFGGSALTDPGLEVPKDRPDEQIASGIPITYVPARNTVFLALALGFAETLGAADLFVGVNCVDYSGYPDCRPEYLRAFEAMANLATKAGVEGTSRFRIHAPLIDLDKPAIIRKGLELGVDYALTHSCYDPDEHGHACGRCDSCRIRLDAFAKLGITDPIAYVDRGTP